MMPIRKMKQVVLLISLIIALWLGAIVILKKLPDNSGNMEMDFIYDSATLTSPTTPTTTNINSTITTTPTTTNINSTITTTPTTTTATTTTTTTTSKITTNTTNTTSTTSTSNTTTTTSTTSTSNATTTTTTAIPTSTSSTNIVPTNTSTEKSFISNVTDIIKPLPIEEMNVTLPKIDLESQQVQRKKILKEVCRMLKSSPLNLKNKEQLDHLIVDDKHKLLYCYVPKVACTNWKRVLMILMGKTNHTDPLQIVANVSHRMHVFRRLSDYKTEEIQHRLKNYMKFMFVRHPFERLLSAYRNKFLQNSSNSDYFRVRFGKQIIKQFRPNATKQSLNLGHDVQFEEFVRYIIDPRTVAHSAYNEHWRPMANLCLPCQINYDIIGKYETLEEDAKYVLDKVKLSKKVKFPRSDRPSSTGNLLNQYLSRLTRDQLLRLYHVYELDFRLFDYRSAGLT